MELRGKTINVLGDSITQGAGASSPETCYCAVLANMFSVKVNNYGVGGTRIARQNPYTDDPYDQDFCLRVRDMDKNADAVVVFGGTNDYGHGNAPLGKMSDRTPATFYGACHDLMNYLVENYTDKPILICTPLRCHGENNPRMDEADTVGPKTLLTYRNAILEVALYYSLPVLDLYAVSGMQPELQVVRERLMPDGLHPSDAGHRILARKIGMALQML